MSLQAAQVMDPTNQARPVGQRDLVYSQRLERHDKSGQKDPRVGPGWLDP